MPTEQCDRILVVFRVPRGDRPWADHLIRLASYGVEHATARAISIVVGPTIIDAIDARLLDGLEALNASLAPDEHEAEMAAWNAGRVIIAGPESGLPYPTQRDGQDVAGFPTQPPVLTPYQWGESRQEGA